MRDICLIALNISLKCYFHLISFKVHRKMILFFEVFKFFCKTVTLLASYSSQMALNKHVVEKESMWFKVF